MPLTKKLVALTLASFLVHTDQARLLEERQQNLLKDKTEVRQAINNLVG
jgi:hypothetical protein